MRRRILLGVLVLASAPFLYNVIRSAHAYVGPPLPQSGPTVFVRQLPLTVNDVVYSPSTHLLYASVPSSLGPSGNSIITIDPTTGSVTNTVFIGSEPNRLALADDGTTLYVSLDGAFAIRKFDVVTQTAGAQFVLGQDPTFGLFMVGDLAVAPGNPNLLAVARQYRGLSPPEGGVAVFDNGVQRPTTGPGHISGSDYLSFSASASKLYGTGFYSGLTTLSVTASGVSITNQSSLASGYRAKFDNGTIFAANGQVINPDTATLLGTFSGVTSSGGQVAFVPESATGRAYYLFQETFSGANRTLRAFDVNTFLPIASVTVPGVNGDVTNMVRWGSNGFAFRTFNQLFLVQTSLVPSADPIPTPTPTVSPTPTPSPSPIATFVRQVSLATNDLVFNNSNQSLYASVPSSVGPARGNSITAIDPVTASIGNSVFVGSEPNKLALSDDAQTMYVALSGAAAVRRFDVPTQTPGLQFSLGLDSFNGPRFANDIAIMPGSPGTVAVANNTGIGTAIYDDGVARSQTHNYSGSLQFRTPSTLYVGVNSAIQKVNVTASGLALTSTTATGSSGNIIYAGGLVYQTGGAVVDPEAGIIKGTFSSAGFGSLMAIDLANNKAFVLMTTSPIQLRAYDLSTFVPLGTVAIQGVVGTPTSLVRWGSNGLAFRTQNQIFLIQTALVNAANSVPSPTPTPSPTPSPSPPYFSTFVRRVDLQANDLVYNAPTGSLLASVASFQGANGNSITKIDPASGAIGQSAFIGSEPNKIAPSDDGNTLHVSLDGAAAIRRFDIPTMTAGTQFSWGNSSQHPSDMAAVPGSPGSVATSDGQVGLGVAIYDNGVRRTNTSRGTSYGIGPIVFGSSASRIYGYDTFSSGFELVKFSVDASGVTALSTTNNVFAGFGGAFKFANGLLYSSQGRICDPEALKLVGTIGGGNVANAIAVDTTLGRIYTVGNSGSSTITLTAYDINTFVPLGSAIIAQNVSGAPTSLVRWGANGLAFRAAPNFGLPGQSNPSAIYIIQSTLVSPAAGVPTGLQFNAVNYNTFEGNFNVSITVNRTGDVSASTTIDYATSDGTATAGSDYTATSGTLTFAPGEFTKTFSIPIINDTLYEGTNETFTITLSNPGGGAVLASPVSATVTIGDNDSKPGISLASTFTRVEGNSTATTTFPVTLTNPSVQTLTIDYTTADGTATAGSDFVASSGTLTFAPGVTSQSISVTVNGDSSVEPDETFFLRLSNPTNASSVSVTQSTVTLVNDDTSLQLSSATSSANESDGLVTVTINRTGLIVGSSTVRFATSDTAGLASCATTSGAASERCDYVTSIGTVSFGPGQNSKTFTIPLVDDALVEGNETFSVALSNATGATLGATTVATVTIVDNDSSPSTTNPIDGVDFFVRQQYLDILGRQPDQTGLQNWINTLSGCPNGGFGEPPTSDCDRLHVAAGFFQSDEFLNRGYWAFRFYMVSFNQRPTYAQFIPDMSQVGGPKSPAEEEASKVAFADAFVQRSEFLSRFGGLSGQALADALTHNSGLPDFKVTGGLTNGQILRAIAERQSSLDKFLTEGTVSILYFGFQRRDPDAIGYQNNVNTLNADPNNLRHMIFIFIYSSEYRGRFGPP